MTGSRFSRIKWPALGLVAVAVAAIALPQLKPSRSRDSGEAERANGSESESAEILRLASIRGAEMRQGLIMYKAEATDSRFPESDRIASYEDLKGLLGKYWRFPAEQDLDFISYTSTAPNTFKLIMRARDNERTELVMTESAVRAGGEPVTLERRRQ